MYRTGQQEYIMASQPNKLEDLFHDTPKDIYFAEKRILSRCQKWLKPPNRLI